MPHREVSQFKTSHDSGGNESALRLKAGESAWPGKKIEGEMLGKAQARQHVGNKKRFQPRGRRRLEPPVVTPKRYSLPKFVYEKDTQHLQAPPSYRLAVTPR